jgi:hypothetical protein
VTGPHEESQWGAGAVVRSMSGRDRWRYPSGAAADLVRLAAVVSAVLVLFDARWEAGIRFLLVFVVLLVPRHVGVPRPFEAAFGAALLAAAWASAAHLYQAAWWVDVVIHFVLGGVTAAMLYLVFAQVGVLPGLHEGVLRQHRISLVVLTVALGLAAGALWELYEWVATSVIPSASITVGYDDTVLDLTMDGSGSVVAGRVLLGWRREGLGTGRRPESDVPA